MKSFQVISTLMGKKARIMKGMIGEFKNKVERLRKSLVPEEIV